MSALPASAVQRSGWSQMGESMTAALTPGAIPAQQVRSGNGLKQRVVQRMVLVSTAHLRWPRSAHSVGEHGALLNRLLAPDLEGHAWFSCLDPAERRDPSLWRADNPAVENEPDPWIGTRLPPRLVRRS